MCRFKTEKKKHLPVEKLFCAIKASPSDCSSSIQADSTGSDVYDGDVYDSPCSVQLAPCLHRRQ